MSETPLKVLSTLMIRRATTPENAVTSQDLATQFGIDKNLLDSQIEALGRVGYLERSVHNGVERIYLSLNGIIAASSVHS
jgi:DNA-binding MarR family transcriptional regulator